MVSTIYEVQIIIELVFKLIPKSVRIILTVDYFHIFNRRWDMLQILLQQPWHHLSKISKDKVGTKGLRVIELQITYL